MRPTTETQTEALAIVRAAALFVVPEPLANYVSDGCYEYLDDAFHALLDDVVSNHPAIGDAYTAQSEAGDDATEYAPEFDRYEPAFWDAVAARLA